MAIEIFEKSFFLVTFVGECPTSELIQGWNNVLNYIDQELELEGKHSVHESTCELHDWDSWTHIWCLGDTRHIFSRADMFYNTDLSITRLTQCSTEILASIESYVHQSNKWKVLKMLGEKSMSAMYSTKDKERYT